MKYAGFKDAHVNFFIACFSAEVSLFAKVSLVFSSLASFYKVSKTGAKNNKAIV